MKIEWRKPLAAAAVALALCTAATACVGQRAAQDLARGDHGESADVAATRGDAEPIPTPAKTGPPLSRHEAALAYVSIVEARNDSMTKLYAVVEAGEDWRTIRLRAGNLVTDNNEEIEKLAATNWPADVAPDVEQLIRDDRRMGVGWAAVSDAKSESAVFAALERVTEGSSAPARIRRKLGLPEPGDDDSPSAETA
ncbi:hypothetical protein [Streptomyces sp. SID3343]|uniref:hypothetical protein n=1 Tax=Streptomyces sp. SID3343 TaxID=2690260 RepID=UPI00136BED04|nr:hypothetical protein [Streptomyces sp. SID3343]MYW04652.1 hypothetical protein [Streptomyces sp. SID3343]